MSATDALPPRPNSREVSALYRSALPRGVILEPGWLVAESAARVVRVDLDTGSEPTLVVVTYGEAWTYAPRGTAEWRGHATDLTDPSPRYDDDATRLLLWQHLGDALGSRWAAVEGDEVVLDRGRRASLASGETEEVRVLRTIWRARSPRPVRARPR